MHNYLVTAPIPILCGLPKDMAATAKEAEHALDELVTSLRQFGCDIIGAGLDHESAYFTKELRLSYAEDPERWYFPAYIHLATRKDPLGILWRINQTHLTARLTVLQTKVIPMRHF